MARVLRSDETVRKALIFKMEGQRKRRRSRKTWRRQVDDEIRGIGLRKEDVLDWTRQRDGVKLIMS